MFKDKTIIILSLMKFDGLPSTNYNIAKYLAKNNKVFYFDHPFTIKDCLRLKGTDSFKIRAGKFSPFSNGVLLTDEENLKVVITPPVLSINWMPAGRMYNLFLKINELIILSRIKSIIKEFDIKNYIFINFFEYHYPGITRKLSAELNIYYCVDPIKLPYDRRHGKAAEEKIVSECDLVICTSRALYEEKKLINKNTYFIPNAADITHSVQALDPDLALHPLVVNIQKPIIGFLGHIERRMDFDLLEKVILAQPDKNFVFAGPVSVDCVPDWFFKLENIYLVGEISYSEIPRILKAFDLCIIPFKKDDVSDSIFPLKLFEYLGAGKNVLATDFNPDLKSFSEDSTVFCSDAISFSESIDRLLLLSEDTREYNLSIAKKNTWEVRIQQLQDIIAQNLQLKRL